jgi:hypothetical protein
MSYDQRRQPAARRTSSYFPRSELTSGASNDLGRDDYVRLRNAIDGNRQCRANFSHSIVSQPAETFGERPHRNALYRVEIDERPKWDWIISGRKQNLTGQPSHRRRTRSNQRSSESGDRGVSGEHHHRATRYVRKLAPPHLPPHGQVLHDEAAASRNEARSPHSSDSSSGWSS